MITKWEIAETGDPKKKYRLLLKCELKDILKIIKSLGAVCSRPERIISNDYNFLIYLFEYDAGIEEKFKNILDDISKSKSPNQKRFTPANVQAPSYVPATNRSASVADTIDIPMPDLEIKENVNKEEELKSSDIKDEPVIKDPEKIQVPDTVAAARENKPKKGGIEPSSQNKSHNQIAKDNVHSTDNKTEVNPRSKVESDNKSSDDTAITKRTAERLKLKWSIELPLNPMLSFQTLITGSHNRFAHAAAMAVVENPGVMYNPILIYGPVGNGKSHFIHSMSYGLSSSIGQKNIFVTNGVKLSIGVNIAIKGNFLDKIERIINDCKVIIIDDIHLMLINKENKAFISKILSQSMQSNKQVVFSSLFSPQELEPLENMIGIQFSQGWMVDIKQPNSNTYRSILDQLLNNMDIKLAEDHIKKFFVSKNLDFRTVSKILFRAKKLERYISKTNNSILHQDMIEMLTGEKDDLTIPGADELKGANFYSGTSDESFYKWGIFYPKGMKDVIGYISRKMKEVASKNLSTELSWETVFTEEYDPDEIYGIPFKIGNFVIDKNINGLIVIGPPTTSALSAKEEEFRHLTEKIMESINIKSAWFYSNRLKANSVYLSAILDLI